METQTAAPARTRQQRMEALRKGNDIRQRRARFKEQMRATVRGDGNAHDRAQSLLTEVPEWVETMKVYDLLMALPKIGRVKANRMLNQCRISPSKTVGGMSERQRKELRVQIAML